MILKVYHILLIMGKMNLYLCYLSPLKLTIGFKTYLLSSYLNNNSNGTYDYN